MKKAILLLLVIVGNITFSYCSNSSLIIASRYRHSLNVGLMMPTENTIGLDLSTTTTAGLDLSTTTTAGLDLSITTTGLDVSITGTDVSLDPVITTT